MRDQGKTARDLLRVVFRRRWLFVFSGVCVMLVILASAPYWPREYTGEAIFETSADPASEDIMQRGSYSLEAVQLTLRQELAGRNAIEEALHALKRTEGLPREADGLQMTDQGLMMFQEMVQQVQRRVMVATEVSARSINYVRVRYTDSDPELAQQLPNQLVLQYRARKPEQRLRGLEGSREFLVGRVVSIEKVLQELGRRRDEVEKKAQGQMPDLGALNRQIEDIQSDIRVLMVQRDTAKLRLAGLQDALSRSINPDEPLSEKRGPNPDIRMLRDQIQQSKLALERMIPPIGQRRDTHPDVIAMRQSIEQLERRLAETPEEIVIEKVYGTPETLALYNMQLAATQAEYEMRNSEIERLQARLANLEALSVNYLPIRQEFHELATQIERRQTELDEAQRQLREIERHVAAEVVHKALRLQMIQEAQRQYLPTFPKLWHILGAALIGGLGAGAGLVFLSHTLDRSVSTMDDADQLFGVPVCGVVGEIVTRRQRYSRMLVFWGLGPAITAVLMMVTAGAVLNAMLWLQRPEEYNQWRRDPLKYVSQQVDAQIEKLHRMR
jgi:uncharacterized protein involved in exopolysaccharide biosynthesis